MFRSPSLSRCCVVAAVLAFAGAAAAQSTDYYEKAARSKKQLEKSRQTIAFLMHPTCTLRSTSYDPPQMTKGGGYKLPCDFRFYSAFGTTFRSTLTFYFDVDGDLDFISVTSTTGMVNPFTAANFVVSWAKDKFKKEIADDPQLLKIVERADARGVLEYYLKNLSAE